MLKIVTKIANWHYVSDNVSGGGLREWQVTNREKM
jgi:hypothetical protein